MSFSYASARVGESRARMTNRERTAPPTIYCEAHRSARTRGGLVSQSTTAYLTEKCEVRNRDVAGGKAVYARELIEPGELIAVWSGRLVSADELDARLPSPSKVVSRVPSVL